MRPARGLVRVGVIGVGHVGRHHARLLPSIPGVVLAGVVDHNLDRARAAAAQAPARIATEATDLLDCVDAVVVAVPTVGHLAVARPFLERGIHVLVEKPMAPTVAEAEAMDALARASGAILAVGHSERFNPAMAAAFPLLRGPRFADIHRLSTFPDRSLDIDVIFDLMIHDLDIMLAVDGSDVVSVEAIGVAVLSPRIDLCNARLRFASGGVANITASRVSRGRLRKARFFLSDAYVAVDFAVPALEVWRVRRAAGERPSLEGGAVPIEPDEPLRRELADFVDAIRGGRAPAVPGRQGIRALELAARVADAAAASG